MNKHLLLGAAAIIALGAQPALAEEEPVLNVYNWSDYIAEDTIQKFEAETGIKVNYDVFDSNEVLEAKMLTGSSGYDIVVPTIEFLARQIQAGAFQPLNKEALSNYGNLDPAILEDIAVNDPDNTHGVPYMALTTGLGYNETKIAERIPEDKIGSWDMVFDPDTAAKLADCGISLLDAPSEVIAIALNYLGLDPNSEDKGDLEKVAELLTAARPHIRYFHSSQYINDLANGDTCVALGWSGDVAQARDRAAEAGQGVVVKYVIPKEGAPEGYDMMAIPVDAPHPENAHKFIDFILRPEIVADITNYVYFANPNTAATEFVADEVKNDPGIYPPEDVKAKLFPLKPHTPRFDRSLTRAWTKMKTGQ